MSPEGEKSADAAQKLLPDCVIVTSPNGCNAAHKADWSPLRGRDIVIWPDADGPGEKYKSDVIDCLIAIGVKSVATITSPVGVKEGWDAADALEEGWTTELVAELVAHAVAAPSLAQDGCHQGKPAVAVESAYEEIRRLAPLAILE
jgi:putative DNA primase/helicase